MYKITPRLEQEIISILKPDPDTRQLWILFGNAKYQYHGFNEARTTVWVTDTDFETHHLHINRRTVDDGTEYWCLYPPSSGIPSLLICPVEPEEISTDNKFIPDRILDEDFSIKIEPKNGFNCVKMTYWDQNHPSRGEVIGDKCYCSYPPDAKIYCNVKAGHKTDHKFKIINEQGVVEYSWSLIEE